MLGNLTPELVFLSEEADREQDLEKLLEFIERCLEAKETEANRQRDLAVHYSKVRE